MQRSIEIVIGKLITDEDFRLSFLRDPYAALGQVRAMGLELTQVEAIALIATECDLWDHVANRIDARLQKASLANPQPQDVRRLGRLS